MEKVNGEWAMVNVRREMINVKPEMIRKATINEKT